jgi:putative hydrolase of HD superfamily
MVDLSGRLRFQKRWVQTPRVPETSVLGHMFTVAVFSYFYSLEINACSKRTYNNFFCALFHDLPEALTKDIISPVKYSVEGLNELIANYEIQRMEEDILPLIPAKTKDEFQYLLGLDENGKDEFKNKIYKNNIQTVDTLKTYNEDKFNPIDGVALKACDKLSAFVEATMSIAHGIKSKQLIQGKQQILNSFEQRPIIEGVDFYKLALEIDEYFESH